MWLTSDTPGSTHQLQLSTLLSVDCGGPSNHSLQAPWLWNTVARFFWRKKAKVPSEISQNKPYQFSQQKKIMGKNVLKTAYFF